MSFRVVVADPPWKFGDKLPPSTKSDTRGAAKNYPVMTTADLCRLVLPPIADDAHLFMWRVSAMQQEALDVVKAWGFTVKSELIWVKRTTGGLIHFGMGHHVRMSHEVCLICTRGKGAGVLNHSTRSVFEHRYDDDAVNAFESANGLAIGDIVFDAETGRHSAKPDAFYEIVRSLVPGPRAELFARIEREGFAAYGNQVPGNPTTLAVAEENPFGEM